MVDQVSPIGTTFSVPATRGQLPALAAGQVVDARVLAIIQAGIVRLSVAGQLIEAKTSAEKYLKHNRATSPLA